MLHPSSVIPDRNRDGRSGSFRQHGRTNSDTYIIRDVTDSVEGGTWRWTRKRPELRFFLESTEQLNFKGTSPFRSHDQGHRTRRGQRSHQRSFARHHHAAEPGVKQIDKPVPPSFLRAKTFNVVVMEIDRLGWRRTMARYWDSSSYEPGSRSNAQAVYILFGAAFTVAVSLALGRLLLRSLSVRLYRQESTPLAFVSGAAV